MKTTSLALALGLALAPWTSWAQTDGYTIEDFKLVQSRNLWDVCTVEESHVNYWETRGFCIGYFTGGVHLHHALELPRLFCAPADVKLDDAIAVFVAYAQSHPEFLDERPMDTVFRAFNDKWPCADD